MWYNYRFPSFAGQDSARGEISSLSMLPKLPGITNSYAARKDARAKVDPIKASTKDIKKRDHGFSKLQFRFRGVRSEGQQLGHFVDQIVDTERFL